MSYAFIIINSLTIAYSKFKLKKVVNNNAINTNTSF